MSPVGYVPPTAADNFRIGDSPITDLPNDFFDRSFGNTTFTFGFNYVVPAGRRAFIDRVDLMVTLDGTVVPGGTIFVSQNFIPSGGPSNSFVMFDYKEGDGPGQASVFGRPYGLLLPGDTLQCFLSSLNCGTAGRFRSMIHGAEYDV